MKNQPIARITAEKVSTQSMSHPPAESVDGQRLGGVRRPVLLERGQARFAELEQGGGEGATGDPRRGHERVAEALGGRGVADVAQRAGRGAAYELVAHV